MDTPRLITLPEELQTAITEYISLPQDLQNLRAVCKEIKPIATARLYRETIVDLTKWSPNSPLYREGHPAHRNIRYLIFKGIPWGYLKEDDGERTTNARRGIKEFLVRLPHGLLKGIQTPGLLPLDTATMSLLATTQKNLVEINLGPIHDSYLALPSVLKPWPTQLRTLEIGGHIGDERDLISYQKMIGNSSNLQEIIFRWYGTVPAIDSVDSRMHDGQNADGLISKTLQRQPTSQNKSAAKGSLSLLVLQDVRLYHANRTFIRHVEFSSLKYLDLFTCPGAAVLLHALTAHFHANGCALKGFTLSADHTDEPRPISFDTSVLVAFINCLSELEYLTLDVWSLTTPLALSNISNHAATLKRLYIGIGITKGAPRRAHSHYVVPLEELRQLCCSFGELSQLAVALPKVDLIDPKLEKGAEYKEYIRVLSTLPKLKVLRSFTWPTVPIECMNYGDTDETEGQLNIPLFDQHLDTLVEDVVGSSSLAKLQLLSFGGRGPLPLSTEDESVCKLNPRCYLVERQGCNTSPSAIRRIKASSIRYHLPDCSAWHRPPEREHEED